jgi:hypothetical protein
MLFVNVFFVLCLVRQSKKSFAPAPLGAISGENREISGI